MINEQILSPVAPHSEGCEFPLQTEKYRGAVEEVLFDRLGRPSFFDAAAEVVMEWMVARIQEENLQARPEACATWAPRESGEQVNSSGKSMRLAPQENGIREEASREVKRLKREIEKQFVETGILELPAAAPLKNS
jgi:hypothetical protein